MGIKTYYSFHNLRLMKNTISRRYIFQRRAWFIAECVRIAEDILEWENEEHTSCAASLLKFFQESKRSCQPQLEISQRRLQRADQHLRVSGLFLRDKIQNNFQETRLRHTIAAKSKKKMVVQPWHGLSVSTTQLSPLLRHPGLWNLSRDLCQRAAPAIADTRFFFCKFHVHFTIRRILYQMGRLIQLCPVISSLMNSIKSLRCCFMEKDLQWVWNKFIERFPFYSRKKSRSGKRLHLCNGSYSYEFVKFSDDEGEEIKKNGSFHRTSCWWSLWLVRSK